MDGIDTALLRTDGRKIYDFGGTGYRAYEPEDRSVLREAQGTWDAPDAEEVATRCHLEALTGIEADLMGI